jgi:tetratricopeptide (TPR) repeat protein
MKSVLKSILVALMVVQSVIIYAQCKEPDFGQDRAKAETNVAIYGDALREGKYNVARGPLVWLLINAPKLSTKIYIDAADIYDKLATAEKDVVKKQVLVDSMLLMYDLRIKSCGEEANVLNRKANASFKYNYKDKNKLPELLALYDKVYELNGNNVTDPTLSSYMNVVDLNAKYVKNLNCEQVLQRYDKIIVVIDAKVKVALEKNKPDQVEKLKGTKTGIDDTMIKTVTGLGCANCDFVKKNMEPKWRPNTNDMEMAKKMFVFMTADKCFDEPLWLELADKLIDNGEEDFGLMKNAAIKHIAKGNLERAEFIVKKASTLAKEPKDKSEALMILGSMEAKKGNKIGARDQFLKANAADPTNLEALSKVGDLYMNSVDDCKKLKSKAEDRLVYLAAFDMYARAKDNGGMARAKAQFPGKEEIFELNWKAGETKSIDCWVGGSVSIRTRD